MKTVTPANTSRRNGIIIAAVVVIALFLLLRACAPHENRYEKLANNVTVALMKNDVEEVRKYQNAETATKVTRARVGAGADFFNKLGKLKSVKETTPKDAPDRTHEFLLSFSNGEAIERMHLDPDDKIVTFSYKHAGQ